MLLSCNTIIGFMLRHSRGITYWSVLIRLSNLFLFPKLQCAVQWFSLYMLQKDRTYPANIEYKVTKQILIITSQYTYMHSHTFLHKTIHNVYDTPLMLNKLALIFRV